MHDDFIWWEIAFLESQRELLNKIFWEIKFQELVILKNLSEILSLNLIPHVQRKLLKYLVTFLLALFLALLEILQLLLDLDLNLLRDVSVS